MGLAWQKIKCHGKKKFPMNPGWMDGWIWQANFFQGALEGQNAALRSHGNRAWLPAGYSWSQVCLLFPGRSRTRWTTRRQRNPRRKRGEGDDLALPLGIKGFLLFVAAKETLREMGFLPRSSIQESRGEPSMCRNPKLLERKSGRDSMLSSLVVHGDGDTLDLLWLFLLCGDFSDELGKAALARPCIPLFFSGKSRIWNSWPAWAKGRHR